MNLITTQFENTLLNYIKRVYLPKRWNKSKQGAGFTAQDLKFFAKGALQLSEAFTALRRNLPRNYFNKKEYRSAYLLYFTLTNYAKMLKCLDEVFKHQNLIQSEYKVLDIGCGPATASLACSNFFASRFPNKNLGLFCLDQNREIIKDARNLFKLLGSSKHKFEAHARALNTRAINSLKLGRFDLIILANVLNELGGVKDQYQFCLSLIKHCLKPDGVLIILDPALRLTTRSLMEMRNLLIKNQSDLEIISPCLHKHPCPMFAQNRRDWCHFYLEWKCPAAIYEVDRLLGIRHNYLKMAYLIIKAGVHQSTTEKSSHKLWRVVSSPLSSKGKVEFVLCGAGRLHRIARLDRDRSAANKHFDYLKRGDITILDEEMKRIGKNTALKITECFNTVNL